MKMIEAKKVVPLIRLILLDNPNIEKICKGMQDVVNIHTIEAEPVKHGRWMDNEDYMFCSSCGMQWNYFDNETQCFKFCPNCGAKMESEE